MMIQVEYALVTRTKSFLSRRREEVGTVVYLICLEEVAKLDGNKR